MDALPPQEQLAGMKFEVVGQLEKSGKGGGGVLPLVPRLSLSSEEMVEDEETGVENAETASSTSSFSNSAKIHIIRQQSSEDQQEISHGKSSHKHHGQSQHHARMNSLSGDSSSGGEGGIHYVDDDDGVGFALDARHLNRVHEELEKLNIATDVINKLELQLDEARSHFRQIHAKWLKKLEEASKKYGGAIAKSRPYYAALAEERRIKGEAQESAVRFERATTLLTVAKQQVALTQESLNRREQGVVEAECLEVLNHHIQRVSEAEQERVLAEEQHRAVLQRAQLASQLLRQLEKESGRSIKKSKHYFELRYEFQRVMACQKARISMLEKEVKQKKSDYTSSLRNLERISDSIHEERSLTSGKRNSDSCSMLVTPDTERRLPITIASTKQQQPATTAHQPPTQHSSTSATSSLTTTTTTPTIEHPNSIDSSNNPIAGESAAEECTSIIVDENSARGKTFSPPNACASVGRVGMMGMRGGAMEVTASAPNLGGVTTPTSSFPSSPLHHPLPPSSPDGCHSMGSSSGSMSCFPPGLPELPEGYVPDAELLMDECDGGGGSGGGQFADRGGVNGGHKRRESLGSGVILLAQHLLGGGVASSSSSSSSAESYQKFQPTFSSEKHHPTSFSSPASMLMTPNGKGRGAAKQQSGMMGLGSRGGSGRSSLDSEARKRGRGGYAATRKAESCFNADALDVSYRTMPKGIEPISGGEKTTSSTATTSTGHDPTRMVMAENGCMEHNHSSLLNNYASKDQNGLSTDSIVTSTSNAGSTGGEFDDSTTEEITPSAFRRTVSDMPASTRL